MKNSFKQYKENRELMEFGQKYEHLCRTIVESGISFDEFWINHGLPYFISGGASTEEELMEGWNPSSWDWKGLANNPTVQAAGTLGRSAASGTAQGIGALGRMAGGAIAGAAQGFGQSQLGQNLGKFFNPQAQQQPAPQPQQPQQPTPQPPQPQQPPAPQPLNKNQQGAANTAMDSIKTEFNKAMQNLTNSQDPVTQQLAQQFVNKVNNYMNTIKINGGPQQAPQQTVPPTVRTSMPKNKLWNKVNDDEIEIF